MRSARARACGRRNSPDRRVPTRNSDCTCGRLASMLGGQRRDARRRDARCSRKAWAACSCSVAVIARRTASKTWLPKRSRTSLLVGCTFGSTWSGGKSRNARRTDAGRSSQTSRSRRVHARPAATLRSSRPLTKSSCMRRSARSNPGALMNPRSDPVQRARGTGVERHERAARRRAQRPSQAAREGRPVAGITHTSLPSWRNANATLGYASAKVASHDEIRANSVLGRTQDIRDGPARFRRALPRARACPRAPQPARHPRSNRRARGLATHRRHQSRATRPSRRATAAIEAKPSPRKPSVAIASRSDATASLLVA